MSKRVLLAAAIASCSIVSSAAYAGSPYYTDPVTTPKGFSTHAYGTSHTGHGWNDEGYDATATDESFGTGVTPTARPSAATPVTAAPDGTIVAVPQYFYHAAGSMGAR